MRRAFALVALLAVACGGGGDAKPAATGAGTTPATTAPPLPAEAKAVVDAVEATYATCPCSVSIRASAFATKEHAYSDTWTGVYDPKAGTASLRAKGAPTTEVRIVGGMTYVLLPDHVWRRLDFSKLPAEPRSAFASLALADPAIAFGLGRAVTFAQETQTTGLGTIYDVEHDLAKAASSMGPSADLFRRFFPDPSMYGNVTVKNGGLVTIGVDADPGDWSFGAMLFVTKTGVPSPKVEAPSASITVDVATFEA
ncbi:MAG TPA: hypothetical protein VF519_11060 [Mycobacteriales bacterium]